MAITVINFIAPALAAGGEGAPPAGLGLPVSGTGSFAEMLGQQIIAGQPGSADLLALAGQMPSGIGKQTLVTPNTPTSTDGSPILNAQPASEAVAAEASSDPGLLPFIQAASGFQSVASTARPTPGASANANPAQATLTEDTDPSVQPDPSTAGMLAAMMMQPQVVTPPPSASSSKPAPGKGPAADAQDAEAQVGLATLTAPGWMPQQSDAGQSGRAADTVALSAGRNDPLSGKPDLPFEPATIAGQAPQSGNPDANSFAAELGAQRAAMSTTPTGTPIDTTTARPTQPAALSIQTPLHDTRWSGDFGNQIVWLARNDQQTAQISIHPEHLGPVQISLTLNGDQISASFASPHAEVRQAIQDAMPNLRETLSGAGINLGQANVGSQLMQQQNPSPQQFSNGPRLEGDKAILPAEIHTGEDVLPIATQNRRGMVDLFA